jgi:hypothetical protein
MRSALLRDRRPRFEAAAVVCLLSLIVGVAPSTAATPDAAAAVGVTTPGVEFRVLESNAQHTVVEVLIPDPVSEELEADGRMYDLLSIPGAYVHGEAGAPALAVCGTTIAVPPASGVSLRVLETTSGVLGGFDLAPVSAVCGTGDEPVVIDETTYARAGFFPAETAVVGEPAILRDFRVVPLRIYPLSYDATTGEVRVTTRIVVELDYSLPGRVNIKTTDRPPSRAFEPLYEELIANYDQVRPRYESDQRGKYLIVTHDTFYNSVLPLAEWKHKRGMEVEVAKLSVIGSSSSAIKSYIQNAYDNWDVPPEYILLVGDTEYLPTVANSDDYYAKLEGSDYLVDAHLGRLSADTVTHADLIVAKTLGYERTPLMEDLDWFRSATLIVRDDYDSGDMEWYYPDTWTAYGFMQTAGFAQIDTLFRRNGSDAADVHAAVTDGRVIVAYRGQGVSNWWSPFDVNPNSTYPGYKLPIVMSATCGTGAFYSDGYPCETWMRAGNVADPKGSVAYVATSKVIVNHMSEWRSAVYRGFFSALFRENLHTVASALDFGKHTLYVLYDEESEYIGWNTQGDPDLDIWTAPPGDIVVTHPPTVPAATSDLVVGVELEGLPVEGALVCAYLDGQVYEVGTTDALGEATLTISPGTPDTLWITVTGHNLHPYEGNAIVTPSGPYLLYASHETDDSAGGNGDGLVSPGEVIELTVTLDNVGPDAASSVSGILSTSDAHVTLVDSTASYGAIPSGGSGANAEPYVIEIEPTCPNGHGVVFSLEATDAGRPYWDIPIPSISVAAADVQHVSTLVDDGGSGGNGNGILEPGETAWIELTVENAGPIDLGDVDGLLSTSNAYAAVTDADGFFGPLGSGGSATSAGNSFRVSVSPGAPPAGGVEFVLTATGPAETYLHSQDVPFTVTLGGSTVAGPCGPDGYGYYAYDAGDASTGQAPVYDWVELVGTGSLISAITNADAATTQLSLPFTFRYYGADYTQISVCSNGFLAMGYEDYRFGDNSAIPNSHGPSAMVAPFWDDLSPNVAGDIYQWYDSANHRFIVQFDAVVHYGGNWPETFEVILLDPAYHATSTGDGIIILQYQTVGTASQATIGIENVAQNDGIQYAYNSSYDPCAAPIVSGQAVKFTTDPPEAPPVWLVVAGSEIDDTSGGDGDGLAEPSETIDLTITIGNLGQSIASAVTATLSTSDPDATVLNGTAGFGDIGGGAQAANASPFVVSIAAEPIGETIEFDLHISTGARYDTWDVLTVQLVLDDTGIDEGELSLSFELKQNAPNPFREGTLVAFSLPEPSRAALTVYSVTGREVASVVDGEFSAGRHTVTWNGLDSHGRRVAAGIYFYRLEAGSNESMKKMILLK